MAGNAKQKQRDTHMSATPAEAAATENPCKILVKTVSGCIRGFSNQSIHVFDGRFVSEMRQRQRTLAEELGVSTQRVQQIERRIRQDLEDANCVQYAISAAERIARDNLEPVETTESFAQALRGALPGPGAAAAYARAIVSEQLGYCFRGEYGISPHMVEATAALERELREISTEDDAGLISKARYAEVVAKRTSVVQRHAQELLAYVGLHQISASYVGFRDSTPAHVKATLLEIGRPAEIREIVEHSGIPLPRIRNHIARLRSIKRINKRQWWLADEIDTPYTSVAERIRDEIRRQGGSALIEDLVSKRPREWKVLASTVSQILSTRAFRRENGRVYLVDENDVKLRPLDQVIKGRDADGKPYWEFTCRARHMRDNLPVTQVPPELILAAGGGMDETVELSIEGSDHLLRASWTLVSNNLGVIGGLAAPLRELATLKPGGLVRITVLESLRVKLEHVSG